MVQYYLFTIINSFNFKYIFFSTISFAPGDVPTPIWRFFTIFYVQYCTALNHCYGFLP